MMMMIVMIMITIKITETIMITITITITNVNENVNMNVGAGVDVDVDVDVDMNMMTCYVEVDGDGDDDNDNDDENDDDDGDNDNNSDDNYDNDDDDDDEDDTDDDADGDHDHDDDDDDADGLWNAWHQSSDKPCPKMTKIIGGSQRTSCSWWNFKIRITCMAMFWTHQDSIFQIRWQAIVQTKVNLIIIWWTVTYNGITWQWRKIALNDSYIQVEQFSLLATAKLIYWTSAGKVMSADR